MDIRRHLEEHRISFDIIPHKDTATAMQMADALDVDPDFVAKTVLLRTMKGYVVAVLPSSCMINLKMAAHALDVEKAVLATEDEMRQVFRDCEVGVIPPFGSLYGLKTLVEHFLTADSVIMFAGNDHHRAYRMNFEDFRRLEHPMVAKFSYVD